MVYLKLRLSRQERRRSFRYRVPVTTRLSFSQTPVSPETSTSSCPDADSFSDEEDADVRQALCRKALSSLATYVSQEGPDTLRKQHARERAGQWLLDDGGLRVMCDVLDLDYGAILGKLQSGALGPTAVESLRRFA